MGQRKCSDVSNEPVQVFVDDDSTIRCLAVTAGFDKSGSKCKYRQCKNAALNPRKRKNKYALDRGYSVCHAHARTNSVRYEPGMALHEIALARTTVVGKQARLTRFWETLRDAVGGGEQPALRALVERVMKRSFKEAGVALVERSVHARSDNDREALDNIQTELAFVRAELSSLRTDCARPAVVSPATYEIIRHLLDTSTPGTLPSLAKVFADMDRDDLVHANQATIDLYNRRMMTAIRHDGGVLLSKRELEHLTQELQSAQQAQSLQMVATDALARQVAALENAARELIVEEIPLRDRTPALLGELDSCVWGLNTTLDTPLFMKEDTHIIRMRRGTTTCGWAVFGPDSKNTPDFRMEKVQYTKKNTRFLHYIGGCSQPNGTPVCDRASLMHVATQYIARTIGVDGVILLEVVQLRSYNDNKIGSLSNHVVIPEPLYTLYHACGFRLIQPTLLAHPTPEGVLNMRLVPAEAHVEYARATTNSSYVYTSNPATPGKFTRRGTTAWILDSPSTVRRDMKGIDIPSRKEDAVIRINRVKLTGMRNKVYFGTSVWMAKPVGPSSA